MLSLNGHFECIQECFGLFEDYSLILSLDQGGKWSRQRHCSSDGALLGWAHH